MLDAWARRRIDPPLDRIGGRLAAAGVRPHTVTAAGFLAGVTAAGCIVVQAYWAALALILANRLADGLDGAVARHGRPSDLGGYVDIVADFLVYAAVPFAFALADPQASALAAAFLIFSFVGTGSSFLAYAVIAGKRGIHSHHRGHKSIYYLGGLTEGTETFALMVALCLFPGTFVALAWGFGAACWVTTVFRVAAAAQDFRD